MRNSWLFLTNLDFDGGYRYSGPIDFSEGLGGHLLSHFYSLVDNTLCHSSHFCTAGSSAVQEAFCCISKYAGALFLWLSASSKSNVFRNLSGGNSHGSRPRNVHSSMQIKHVSSCRKHPFGFHFGPPSSAGPAIQFFFTKVAGSTIKRLWKEVEALPVLSLAAAIIPPFDNFSSKALSECIPLENADEHINRSMDQLQVEHGRQACATLAVSNLTWSEDALEPKTGIKFPIILDSPLACEDGSCPATEVLVGTGSRSLTVLRIKSLKIYAFGLYVHPDSVCEKLGPKYASVPVPDLTSRVEFFDDLLRQDIPMTVRLVVNYNGLKISTVRDAFEKSLRNRLQKMNPNTDYHCLRTFGSYFTEDIPLPVGTTIHFRQTADGQLITEIGGKQIGAVRSKDLCRAFFDMYIGDLPVSEQTKREVAQNVAGLIGRC
ncbi:Chalcone isomerase protein [Dioscorea alata]|uniref:Chalcone isomerase protein n=1 Tax=Dioscorea alata TaxID=55571 RepID=A0ACB7U534_DIOAL|nr:Chalcone isomerase protein [Dioscorea alata]